jgi:5-methylcytosine-specific restriction enzyme subunit McrC
VQVRVENLYYLLCYAWQCLDARDIVPVSEIAGRSPEALFARVLSVSVGRLMKQGLERGYVEQAETTRRPRGKIDFGRTLSGGVLNRGAVECAFDELTPDIFPNRAIKAALRSLARADAIDSGQRSQLHALIDAMAGVADVEDIGPRHFAGVSLRGGLRRYRLPLSICELLSRRSLLDEQSGKLRFSAFLGSDQEMGRLFEDFLRQFFRLEQRKFTDIGARTVAWDLSGDDQGHLASMRTDVMLRRPGETIIVEAKCYGSSSQAVGKTALLNLVHSDHVYQLMAYVTNHSAGASERVSGALLYATDHDQTRPASFKLLGHPVHVAGVNLDQPWQRIHDQLIGLVERFAYP